MPDSALDLMSPACRQLKRVCALVAALAVAACVVEAHAGLPKTQKQESRHEIDQLEDQWRDAVLTSNTTAMNSLLADDYVAITASGTLQTKEDTLANLRSGRIHISTLTVSDRKVRFYGSTAVVTSLADIQATTADGEVNGSYRYTRIYLRDPQGQWKIVSFEATRVREPGPHRRNEFH